MSASFQFSEVAQVIEYVKRVLGSDAVAHQVSAPDTHVLRLSVNAAWCGSFCPWADLADFRDDLSRYMTARTMDVVAHCDFDSEGETLYVDFLGLEDAAFEAQIAAFVREWECANTVVLPAYPELTAHAA